MKAKDLVIQRLHSELEAADVDHKRLQGAHIQMMDLIIGSAHIFIYLYYCTNINYWCDVGRYKQKCIHLHESFVHQRNRIVSTETNELNRVRKNLEEQCHQLQNIIFGQDKRIENVSMQTKVQNAVNIYSIVYLVWIFFSTLCSICERWMLIGFDLCIKYVFQKENSLSHLMHYVSNEVEGLWRQLNETIIEYEKNSGDKRKQYEYLKEQDDAHRVDVAQYPKLQIQLQGTINSLKQDTHTLSQKREQSITELNDRIVRMRKRAESLRHIFSTNQVLDATQLKRLTIISATVLKVKILNYHTFCLT